MTETNKTNYLLAFFGVGALCLAVFLESGLFSRPTARELQLEELHRVADAAQVWFVRPVIRGGGGDSFELVDFQQIGLAKTLGALEWEGSNANYKILDRNREQFILQVNDPTGQTIAIDTLGFDTYPSLNFARR